MDSEKQKDGEEEGKMKLGSERKKKRTRREREIRMISAYKTSEHYEEGQWEKGRS